MLLTASFGRAAVQRIAFSPGSIPIKAGENVVRFGLCLNKMRPAPSYGQPIKHVLSAAEDAVVRIKGQGEFSLPQAIERNFIRLEGTGPESVALRITNCTDDDLDFIVKKPAVLGAEVESIDDLKNLADLLVQSAQNSEEDLFSEKGSLQQRIWNQQRKDAMAGLRDGTLAPESPIVRDSFGEFVHGEKRAYGYEAVFYDKEADQFEKAEWSVATTPVVFARKSDGSLDSLVQESARFYTEKCAEKVMSESSEGISFAHVGFVGVETGARARMQLGKQTVQMDAAEFSLFLEGGAPPKELKKALSEAAPNLQIIFWRDGNEVQGQELRYEFSEADTQSLRRLPGFVDPTLLANRLQSLVANHGQIYLASDFELARKNLAALPRVKNAADINIYDDIISLDPANRALLSPITENLKASGMSVSSDEGVVAAANLVIITGRKNEELDELVANLGRRGALKDKLVVMLSCGEGGEEDFNRELLDPLLIDGKPFAVLFYRERINPSSLKKVLLKLAAGVKGHESLNLHFRTLFLKAIEDVLHEADPADADTLKDLKVLQGIIVQLSLADPPPDLGSVFKSIV
jgi:hypothetical protein